MRLRYVAISIQASGVVASLLLKGVYLCEVQDLLKRIQECLAAGADGVEKGSWGLRGYLFSKKFARGEDSV